MNKHVLQNKLLKNTVASAPTLGVQDAAFGFAPLEGVNSSLLSKQNTMDIAETTFCFSLRRWEMQNREEKRSDD